MINRRNFIKLGSLAAVSLSSGFGFGKLFAKCEPERFAVYGFLPQDELLINKTVSFFIRMVNFKFSTSFDMVLMGNKQFPIYEKLLQHNSLVNTQFVSFKINRINDNIDSDVIINDSKHSIYSIENNFSDELLLLRQKLKESKAELFFSAEFAKVNLISKLFQPDEKQIVIENESGIYDKIDFNKNYKHIAIKGPQGNMDISVDNGIVKVTKPTCKHKLCQNNALSQNSGNIIACAPNKVLIRIEKV